MKNLNLDYLNLPVEHPIIELLKEYGGQISNKTNQFITYIYATGTGTNTSEIRDFSFYIVAPEIDKQHKLISIEYKNVNTLKTVLWPLKAQQLHSEVTINGTDLTNLDNKLYDFFDHPETKKLLKHLLSQTIKKLQMKQ